MSLKFWFVTVAAVLVCLAIWQTMPEALLSTIIGCCVALAVVGYVDIRRER